MNESKHTYKDKDELRRLLNCFYNGDTTLAEEELLKKMLYADDCSSDFKSDRCVISMLSGKHSMPDDLRDDIIKNVHTMAKKSQWKRVFITTVSVAASIAIVVFAWNLAVSISVRPRIIYPSTPENAILQAQQALMSISRELNEAEQIMPEKEELLNRMVVNNEVEMDEFMIEVIDSGMVECPQPGSDVYKPNN